jgi:hypothetical protein
VRHIPRIKLLLAVLGLAAFFYSIRTGINTLRYIGIALVAIAWGLRFVPEPKRDDQLPSEMR